MAGDVGGDVPGHVAVDPPGRGHMAAGLLQLADLRRGQGGHEHRHAPAAAAHAGREGERLLGAAQRAGQVAGQPADVALELEDVALPPGGVGLLGLGEAAQRLVEAALDAQRPAERHDVPGDPVGAAVGPGLGHAAPQGLLRLREAALVEERRCRARRRPGPPPPAPRLRSAAVGHLAAAGLEGRQVAGQALHVGDLEGGQEHAGAVAGPGEQVEGLGGGGGGLVELARPPGQEAGQAGLDAGPLEEVRRCPRGGRRWPAGRRWRPRSRRRRGGRRPTPPFPRMRSPTSTQRRSPAGRSSTRAPRIRRPSP